MLTERQIRSLKPADKEFTVSDGVTAKGEGVLQLRVAKAGLSKELRDRIQGHAFNDVSSKHYDRYDYFPEKRKGLDRWAAWLEKNVLPQKD